MRRSNGFRYGDANCFSISGRGSVCSDPDTKTEILVRHGGKLQDYVLSKGFATPKELMAAVTSTQTVPGVQPPGVTADAVVIDQTVAAPGEGLGPQEQSPLLKYGLPLGIGAAFIIGAIYILRK